MGQTLNNGLYLPDEGERYCYDGLASNWTILDAVVGGYNAHIGNTTIHITSEERIKWNTGVTQAYVLRYASSSVSANSTVAYSSLDNVDNVKIGDKVLDQDGKMYSVTAVDSANSQITVGALLIDLSKDSDLSNYYTKEEVDAFDSNAMHKTGAETVAGIKTFSSNVNVYNSDSSTDTANIVLKNSKAERGTEFSEQSINFVDKNNNPLAKISCYGTTGTYTRLYITAFDTNNNSDGFYIRKSTTGTVILPTTASAVALGNSAFTYYNIQTKRVNALEPSALSLPSGNVSDFIDIRSYFSNTGSGGTNTYTALANGWIYLRLGDITSCQVILNDSSNRRLWGTSATGNVEQIIMPILKNATLTTTWVTNSTVNVATARFIPCQGNV